MRILFIHNLYQYAGGEDVVLEMENNLLKNAGIETEVLIFDNKEIQGTWRKIITGIRTVYSSKSRKILAEKIESFRPDLIHVHNFFPLASPSIFYEARSRQIPIVMTLHNYRLICPGYSLFYHGKIYEASVNRIFPLDAIMKGVYRDSRFQTAAVALMTGTHKLLGTWRNKVDRYIALTEFARNKFLNSSLNVSPEKLVVKPNFTPDYGAGGGNRSDYFLFIGRLTEEKGIPVLLETFRKTSAKIKILGDGPLKEDILNLCSERSNVEYLGFKSKSEIVQLLQNARALVFPSTWYEGMPMTIIESFSTATPVIASDLGGPAEMIVHRENGLKFSPGSSLSLLEQLRIISEDQDLWQLLSKNARNSYLQKYTQKRNLELLIKIYNDLIVLQP
jgi:glycosyltransferase involved in cell wall biosynthesis